MDYRESILCEEQMLLMLIRLILVFKVLLDFSDFCSWSILLFEFFCWTWLFIFLYLFISKFIRVWIWFLDDGGRTWFWSETFDYLIDFTVYVAFPDFLLSFLNDIANCCVSCEFSELLSSLTKYKQVYGTNLFNVGEFPRDSWIWLFKPDLPFKLLLGPMFFLFTDIGMF